MKETKGLNKVLFSKDLKIVSKTIQNNTKIILSLSCKKKTLWQLLIFYFAQR